MNESVTEATGLATLNTSNPAVHLSPAPTSKTTLPATDPLRGDSPEGRRHQRIEPWLALLSGLAVLLNAWPVPLYYGVHLLLGSVPPILALLLWRTWWAVPLATLAALQTWKLWGHPWAVVIFTLEIVWLTVAMRRFNGPPGRDGNGRVVLFAMGYWLLLGCPLVLLFYGLVLGIDPVNVAVVAVKQAFNGVFNTVLAFSLLILIQGIRSRRNRGPGVSLRGLIMALSLLAITLPTLATSLAAGHQLEAAIQRGALDRLQTVNLAVARAGAGNQNTRLLMEQLGEGLAYRRFGIDGRTQSSAPDLFKRLDGQFEDGGRSNVRDPELAILIPRGDGPILRKWINGYWSYSRQYTDAGSGGTSLVQVVEPARRVVTRLQHNSTILLGVTFAVMVLGALASLRLGRIFEREFQEVLSPLTADGGGLHPLQLSAISELRTMAHLINHRIHQVNSLGNKLRQANTTLRRSRAEMKELLHNDPLTGCGNQQALDLRLNEEVIRCQHSGEPLSCLVLDVDAFRLLNKEHGRRAGDALLRGLAKAASRHLGATDHLYRWRNDTFVVLSIGSGAEAAGRLGETMRKAMDRVVITPVEAVGPAAGLELRAGVSLGQSQLEAAPDNAEALLDRALEDLHRGRARRQGGGTDGGSGGGSAAGGGETPAPPPRLRLAN